MTDGRFNIPACAGMIILLMSLPAFAAEKAPVTAFTSDVTLHEDGSMDVSEHYVVENKGRLKEPGMFRDFPAFRLDASGRLVRVHSDILQVDREGERVPYIVKYYKDKKRLFFGKRTKPLSDDYRYSYTLRYRITGLTDFPRHDSPWSWIVLSNHWTDPIAKPTVRVHFPASINISDYRFLVTGEQVRPAAGVWSDQHTFTFTDAKPVGKREKLRVEAALPAIPSYAYEKAGISLISILQLLLLGALAIALGCYHRMPPRTMQPIAS